MTNVPIHIAHLLDKMTSMDKDFRFMATNDLMAELQKDSIKLDDESERKVVKMLLRLLEDKNGEVQNLAVKCLGPLVNKVKDPQVETIVDSLCNNMLSDKEQLRDISSIGLKTVISELAPASITLASNVCKKITGRLTSAISKQEDVSVQLESLDILSDLLGRFGGLLVQFHSTIQQALLLQLSSQRLAVRKRAIIAISHLVATSSGNLFSELLDFLIGELIKNTNASTTRTYIQCLGSITRQAGQRMGEHLQQVIPIVVQFCTVDDDELREYCIQTMESFARRCPKNVTPYISTIVKICLTFLVYDPNYNYEEDIFGSDGMEVGDRMDDEDPDDQGDDRSAGEYSDDDDMSWKVRRASAKCLTGVIATRHEMLREFYETVSPALIARFKEREENVKYDIFMAYITLLNQTRPAVLQDDSLELMEGPASQLASQIPSIVKSMQKLLKDKSVKTRQGCFSLLSELIQVLPGALRDHISTVIAGIQFSFLDKTSSSNMKIEALVFFNLLVSTHQPMVFYPYLDSVVPLLVQAIGDPFYKICSEALLVTQQLIRVIRPLNMPAAAVENSGNTQSGVISQTGISGTAVAPIPSPIDIVTCKKYLDGIFPACLIRLKATDIDQEVKERAISCIGQVLCNMGDLLGSERLLSCLPILLDRLKNEITRLTAVKALAVIASSPLKIDVSCILQECLPLLASFLRKNHRGLRLVTLQCLEAFVRQYGDKISDTVYQEIVKESGMLILDLDLHVAQLALLLGGSVCRVGKFEPVKIGFLPQVMQLIRSPLLQGGCLQGVIDLLVSLGNNGRQQGGVEFGEMFAMLTSPVQESEISGGQNTHTLHKQAYHTIAKCIASLLVNDHQQLNQPQSPSPQTDQVVQKFLQAISDMPETPHSIVLLALLTIGEIGRSIDLSRKNNDNSRIGNVPGLPVENIISGCFWIDSDEIKQAAALALGGVTVGNLKKFLPFVLGEIEAQPKRQYLLLHSLKEVIGCRQKQEDLRPFVHPIWDLLMRSCECQEEGTRNIVAECLGKLALIDPVELLPKLKACLQLPSPHARSTAIAAVKFTVSDQPQAIDPLLRQSMGDFLEALNDVDLNVRRVALVAFNSAAHNKPLLMRDLLQSVLPHLYRETKVCKELIREVEMGPFKHTVDDGLDIRKAAFECMYTLLDSCLDRIDVFEFLTHVEDGLNDHYDIKMLAYLMLVRLSHLCPSAVLQHLDRLVEPLKITCTTKVRATSVKQEFEKQDELKRSAMRAVAALLLITDADKCPQLADFMCQVRQNPELTAILESVKESNSVNVASVSDTPLMDMS